MNKEQLVSFILQGHTDEAVSLVLNADTETRSSGMGFARTLFDILIQQSLDEQQIKHLMTFVTQVSPYFPNDSMEIQSFIDHFEYLVFSEAKKNSHAKFLAFFLKANICTEKDIAGYYQKLDKPLFKELLTELIKQDGISAQFINELSIRYYDLALYNDLQQIFHTLNKKIPDLSNESLSRLNVLKACPKEHLAHLNSIIVQLMPGFQIKNTLDKTAAHYLLAATRDEKRERYDFLPTLLFVDLRKNNVDEFINYLRAVSQLPRPVKERFLLADRHWQSGEIQIDEDNNVKLFISDSDASDEDYAKIYCEVQFDLLNLKQIFPEQNIELYFLCGNHRQHTGGTCSTFALDDVRHFYTIDLYGPQEDLFKQLDDRHVKDIRTQDDVVVHLCNTPPSLHRTMQSRRVFEAPNADLIRIVNKRNQTVQESTLTHFSRNQNQDLQHNQRLAIKAQHRLEALDHFIMETLKNNPLKGYDEITKCAYEHTLPAFIEKSLTNSSIPVPGP